MTNSNNDIEELEELLTELEGQEAQLVTPYAEDDDAVTQQMEAPLGDQEWMVQVTALDRRMMSMAQLMSELQVGKLSNNTLVWRGGMDDWLPIARVEELSQAALRPLSPPSRLALGKSLPAPPPSQPAWSSRTSSSLPPPPVALPPSMLAPPPSAPLGLPKPVAMALPPPAASHSTQSSNTTRPVAVDFSDVTPETPAPMQSKRAVMALSAMAILAVFVTVYAVSGSKPGGESSAAAQPQAINALQPAGTDKKAEQSPSGSTSASKPEPAAAAPSLGNAPSSDDNGSATASASTTRQANAPARYSPRSEYRRRNKASSGAAERSTSEEEERTAAASPPPATPTSAVEEEAEPASEVAATAADDDADSDEAPKSTGKPGNTFNREAAKAALDQAASQAKNCRPQGGPSGTGRVQVRYEPSGKVGAVSILTNKFENTTTGSCVRMLFRRAKVPEFSGAPVVVVNKSFEIP
jgi:hypothetical protein